jgi:hypothetical protein
MSAIIPYHSEVGNEELTQHPCSCTFQRVLAVLVLHMMKYLTGGPFQIQTLVAARLSVLQVLDTFDHLQSVRVL